MSKNWRRAVPVEDMAEKALRLIDLQEELICYATGTTYRLRHCTASFSARKRVHTERNTHYREVEAVTTTQLLTAADSFAIRISSRVCFVPARFPPPIDALNHSLSRGAARLSYALFERKQQLPP